MFRLYIICRLIIFTVFSFSYVVYRYCTSGIWESYNIVLQTPSKSSLLYIFNNNTTISLTQIANNQANVVSHLSRGDNGENNIGSTRNIVDWLHRINLNMKELKVDFNFAHRLRNAQNNTEFPLVNDVVVSKCNHSWNVYVIINFGNVMKDTNIMTNSSEVKLVVGNFQYDNVFAEPRKKIIRLLKYEVPRLPISGIISLYDFSTNVSYKNLPYRALMYQPKRKIAICAYISNYNTINEIKSFLAFYLLQNIDNIILYCSVNCEIFKIALRREIISGYVILYEYPWPLTKKYGSYQRSIQCSQINSCYYRHRNFFEYIISQDVDEYFYSERYPYDLYKAIRSVFALNPDKHSLAVLFSGS